MGCFYVLLKLLIALCIYIFLITDAYGAKKKKPTKKDPKKKIYKFNVSYCIDNTRDKKLNELNIKTGLEMISKHSCVTFSPSKICQMKKENCMVTCTYVCEKWKYSDDKKCKECFEPYKKCDKCTYECEIWKKKSNNCKCKNKACKNKCKECDKCKKKCKGYEEKYEKCKDDCVNICLKPTLKCEKNCTVVPLPFIRFFYNGNKNNSDFYFNGSTTLYKQEVYNMEIDVSCNKKPGCIAKKVLMYLGLIPTVRRKDRDDFITVNYHNIDPGYKMQYSILNNVTLYTKYDYSSIGHVSDNYGALSDKKKTYDRKSLTDSRVFLTGQEIRPVFSDLKWLYHEYCEKQSHSHLLCENYGYPKSDGSNTCECPSGYTGKYCDKLQYTGPLCPNNHLYIKESQEPQPLAFYSKANCTVNITAPEGKRIRITVEILNCTSKNPCFENDCLQIKYGTDMTNTGLCLCGTLRYTSLTTASNTALVQYTGKHYRNYAFIYYQVNY